MQIEVHRVCENHPDRDLQHQECVGAFYWPSLKGWKSVETVEAMQEDLMWLRLRFNRDLVPDDRRTLVQQPYYDG
ncbi:hypothetical protein LJR098_002411 [Rhizobium sp. LjRoot98]|uniref:hypothetical protein n=1 Tax=unclassified Rhizobium TaxID=2613769 RepID=UPI0007135011|nr:hypothetical protein [Rhizobium sp. Root1204]KQV36438.1 hypothetical protein ASC96_28005 [Rhizobium sp. Root1204]